LRFGYDVSAIIHLDASAGLEWRQFGGSREPALSPVFDVAGSFAPTERTTLTLSAGRSSQSSVVLVGQNFTDSTVTLSVRQEIGYRVACVLMAGYHNLAYSPAAGGIQSSRSDDHFLVRVGANVSLTPRLFLAGFYQFRKNVSTDTPFNYANNQTGIALSWEY
jgi:hypothetical protein